MPETRRAGDTALPLLETKLFPPRWRTGLVQRQQLIDRLQRGVEGRLTLLSAPAGSGKTTLLAEWLAARRDAPVAWLSLDPADSDPVRFWTYVAAALERAAGVGAGARAMLESPAPPPLDVVLAALLNDAARHEGDLVLVLDDYHVIESAAVHDSLAYLVDHLPPSLHLVILSRADPVLPLARLRARGDLAEIRAAGLRFSAGEAAHLLNDIAGLDLDASEVAALEERTEGWIAGIQLAALSMRGRDDAASFIAAFTGDDRYVVDYLMEEVLHREPEEVRNFLLRTAILDRLSGSLCDRVTGQSDGAELLEALERRNLFLVPLDDQRRWYRYHHLFADVLRARLMSRSPEELPGLHLRASEWFAEAGDVPQAILHALAGGHAERAAVLIESIARETVRAYRPLQLVEWIRRLPEEVVEQRPVLSAYYAFGLFPAGELDAASHWLDVAERHAPSPADRIEGDAAALPGIIAVARGYRAMATGDVPGTVEATRRALTLLPADEHTWRAGAALLLALAPWRLGDLDAAAEAHAEGVEGLLRAGDVPLAVSAIYDAGQLAVLRGRLDEAQGCYQRALALLDEAANPHMPGAADAHLGLSALAVERGDVGAAAEHLRAAERLAEQALLPETLSRLAVGRAILDEATGDLDAAIDAFDEAARLAVPATVPGPPIASMRARAHLRAGRTDEVEAWLEAQACSAEDAPAYAGEHLHLTLARLLIDRARRGHPDAARVALDLLARYLEDARGRRGGSVIEILLLRALALGARGETDAALDPLAEALRLAEPEGYCRTLTVEGAPMRDLLRAAIAAGHSTAYATRLLAALGDASEAPAALGDASEAPAASTSLAEPLTARETEILRLVAAGMRNQEIADHLVISVATVKRHIANAYGKLGVDHRTEAVARANDLRLI